MHSDLHEDYIVKTRRFLHRHPELSFKETETLNFIEAELKKLGLNPVRVENAGIYADVEGASAGKTVAVRADMDALPVTEENTVPYISENKGVMHACGHDAHIAMLLGLTRILVEQKDKFSGKVRLLFQQAEEQPPGGAVSFIRAGLLRDVDFVLGQHVYSNFDAGKAAIYYREEMANADEFRVKIHGKGGHGSEPEGAVDALIAAVNYVNAAQTIVSRNISPHEVAVITFGTINSGYRYNIIAAHAELTGTVRTFSSEVQELIIKRLEEVLKGICSVFGTTYEFDYIKGYPVVINNEKVARVVEEAAIEVLGPEGILHPKPVAGGEDFAYYLEEVPGAFYFLGVRNPEIGIESPQHSPTFNLDESAMKYGTEILYLTIMKLLDS